MTKIVQFQTNFSVGELDPLLKARTDLEQYQNALETATNVYVQPQGGVRRRDGLKFIYDFGSSFTKFKIIPFEFSVADSYTLVIVTGRIYVFKAGVLQTNINGTGLSYITASAITLNMIDEIDYTQSIDTIILTHGLLPPQRIVRNGDTLWTFEPITFTSIPRFAYTIDLHLPLFSITPSATSGNITITASAATTDTGTAQAGSADTITLKSASSFTADNECNGMWIHITSGTGSGQKRHIHDYVGATKVALVYPAWTTAPDNTSGYSIHPFEDAAVGEFINVRNGFGRAKVIEWVSHTEVKAYVLIPFFDTAAITTGNWESEHGYEDTWSTTRGWPKTVTFHQQRLYFGGTDQRPNTVWGSQIANYFNFDTGTALADESLEATINTNQLNVITHIISSGDLRIFTTAAEFVIDQAFGEPITPTNFQVKVQSRYGTKPGVPIEDLNGATVFVQRQGKSLISFQYTDSTNSYQSTTLSILSSHLIKTPTDLAIRRATSTDETDRLFLVNGDDGSMSVYSILTVQNIIAPSQFQTDGDFIAVAVEINDVYVVVKRTINGTAKYFLEKFDKTLTLDSALTGGAASSVNVTQLEDKSISIIRDGAIENNQTVPVSPYTITFSTPAATSYEVGLNYEVLIVTMPTEPRLRSGSVQGVKKRIIQIDALVYESQSMNINNVEIPFRNFGEDVLDKPIEDYTGIKTLGGLLGFSNTGQITVRQTVPLKMTLLGLEYRMSIGN
jgi:hypothetical protein